MNISAQCFKEKNYMEYEFIQDPLVSKSLRKTILKNYAPIKNLLVELKN